MLRIYVEFLERKCMTSLSVSCICVKALNDGQLDCLLQLHHRFAVVQTTRAACPWMEVISDQDQTSEGKGSWVVMHSYKSQSLVDKLELTSMKRS